MSGQWWKWALFWVLVLVTAVSGLFFVVAAADVLIGNLGADRSDTIIGDLFFLVLTVLLALATREAEHKARTAGRVAASPTAPLSSSGVGRPIMVGSYEGPVREGVDGDEGVDRDEVDGQSADMGGARPVPPVPPEQPTGKPVFTASPGRRWRGRRYRRDTPHSALTATIIFGCLAGLMVVVAIGGFVDAARSDRVQHHGIPAPAFVTDVTSTYHSGSRGSPGYTTYNLVVHLSRPVDGHQQYTIDTPEESPPAADGVAVSILVDPSDPSYAELAGEPNNTVAGGWVGVFLAVLLAAGTVGEAVHYRYLRAKQKAEAA